MFESGLEQIEGFTRKKRVPLNFYGIGRGSWAGIWDVANCCPFLPPILPCASQGYNMHKNIQMQHKERTEAEVPTEKGNAHALALISSSCISIQHQFGYTENNSRHLLCLLLGKWVERIQEAVLSLSCMPATLECSIVLFTF